MKKSLAWLLISLNFPLFASANTQLEHQIRQLQIQTKALQAQLQQVQRQVKAKNMAASRPSPAPKGRRSSAKIYKASKSGQPFKRKSLKYTDTRSKSAICKTGKTPLLAPPEEAPVEEIIYHSALVSVHIPTDAPYIDRYFPTALIADDKIITYIAGTPVVTSPYTGDRPAFDGSDHIVNISSINRDIRLMQQRRRVYNAYENLGYGIPKVPIIALSGKVEPYTNFSQPYFGNTVGDISLGSTELDVAAALNDYVEAFFSIVFDENPPMFARQRVANSAINLNMGFVNIGDLDETPFYFTAGQLYAPFGRYSSSMISAPLPMVLARTKARLFILGYKSQGDYGPYAAVYTFASDTTHGHQAVGGYNLGYTIQYGGVTGDVGFGYIGSLDDSRGMQFTATPRGPTFGGFASLTNGNENVAQTPGADVHANFSFSRYSLTAEWVGATRDFRTKDLSYNGHAAKPSAGQVEAAVTFLVFDKPAFLAAGYQWSHEALALNLPKKRSCGVFGISIWRDTVESLEYRHDKDYSTSIFANGANAPGQPLNLNTLGTGRSADTVVAQIGVYF